MGQFPFHLRLFLHKSADLSDFPFHHERGSEKCSRRKGKFVYRRRNYGEFLCDIGGGRCIGVGGSTERWIFAERRKFFVGIFSGDFNATDDLPVEFGDAYDRHDLGH